MSKKILSLVAIIIGVSFFAGVHFSLADNPSVTILAPNGGETFKNDDSSITVKWQTNNIPSSHKFILIRLRAVLDSREYNLAQDVLNDGQEILSIPATVPVGDYTLEIKTYVDNVLAMDSSDSYFKIADVSQNQPIVTVSPSPAGASQNQPTTTVPATTVPSPVDVSQNPPSVTIISPNGGETYKNDGNPITVKWQTTNVPTSQTFDIIRLRAYPNGQEYNLIYDVLNDGQEVITIPSSVPVGAYTLEIKTYVSGALAMDSSDSYFKIVDVSQNQSAITVSSTNVNVKEQVKCVFKGATSEQKCYTATDSSNSYSSYACSGTESCVVDLKGINGNKITWKSSCGGYAYSVMDGSSDYAIFDCTAPAIAPSTTSMTPATVNSAAMAAQEKKEQIIDINEKSKLLSNNNFDFILAELNQLRSIIKEQQTEIKYLKSLAMDAKNLSEKSLSAINNFITYGVDSNTEKLGAGERAAVINSYKAAFDKLPATEAELADAIKIANGRFPSITSNEAEKTASEQFNIIYKRSPDLNNANDNAAIKVMAYGLRQKAENRNLNSEKAGIQIFKNIFGTVPKTTEDWNTMQAITYSGATR